MRIGLNYPIVMASAVGLLVVVLVGDTIVSYQFGTQHIGNSGAVKLLAKQVTQQNSSIPSGPNSNFGSFTIVGIVQNAADNGVVLQTAGDNLIHILIDQHSSIVLPSGKPLAVSKLERGNVLSAVVRINAAGQFVALRIIQQ